MQNTLSEQSEGGGGQGMFRMTLVLQDTDSLSDNGYLDSFDPKEAQKKQLFRDMRRFGGVSDMRPHDRGEFTGTGTYGDASFVFTFGRISKDDIYRCLTQDTPYATKTDWSEDYIDMLTRGFISEDETLEAEESPDKMVQVIMQHNDELPLITIEPV